MTERETEYLNNIGKEEFTAGHANWASRVARRELGVDDDLHEFAAASAAMMRAMSNVETSMVRLGGACTGFVFHTIAEYFGHDYILTITDPERDPEEGAGFAREIIGRAKWLRKAEREMASGRAIAVAGELAKTWRYGDCYQPDLDEVADVLGALGRHVATERAWDEAMRRR